MISQIAGEINPSSQEKYIPPSCLASNAIHMEDGICQQPTDRTRDGRTTQQVRHSLRLLLTAVDHSQVQVEARKESSFARAENQSRRIQRAYGLDEAREDRRQRPDDAEASENVPRGELLHQDGPGGFEEDVGDVENGDCRRELAIGCVDVFRHIRNLDISCCFISFHIYLI